MSRQTLNLTNELYEYLLSVSLKETAIQKALRERTAAHPLSNMQIAPEQGQFMTFLIRLMQAKNIIEIGTFTGYSTLCMAMALPEDGRLIACDISVEYTDIARDYWQQAGVEGKIQLEIAPALETLEKLVSRKQTGQFDFVFIDAEKTNYIKYYELSLELLSTNGLICVDNVLWSGHPADKNKKDEDTVAIREFNNHIYNDKRVDISLLPVADGITLILKK